MGEGIVVINVGLIALFVLIFVFFYIKDGETQKKFNRYEKALDDLNKELYKIQKILKNKESNGNFTQGSLSDDFRGSLEDIYAIIEKDREYVDKKLADVEAKIKSMNSSASSFNNADDARIISMFKDGYSVDVIARELMRTRSEIESVLKRARVM